MNKLMKLLLVAILCLAPALDSVAQSKGNNHGKEEWKEKMRSEKISFFTSELDLTPEVAEAFWPVYNEMSKKQWGAMKKVMASHKAMMKACSEGGDYTALLEEHKKACQENEKATMECISKISEIFGDEMAVKVIVTEEKFRRMQIHRLHK